MDTGGGLLAGHTGSLGSLSLINYHIFHIGKDIFSIGHKILKILLHLIEHCASHGSDEAMAQGPKKSRLKNNGSRWW